MLFICCTKFHLWTLSASKCMNSRFRNVRVHLMSVIHICACVEFIYRLRYIYHNIMFSLTHGTTCTLHFSQSYLQFEQYISNNSEPPTPETDNPYNNNKKMNNKYFFFKITKCIMHWLLQKWPPRIKQNQLFISFKLLFSRYTCCIFTKTSITTVQTPQNI